MTSDGTGAVVVVDAGGTAAELVARARERRDGPVAWVDRRLADRAEPERWTERLRHRLEILHAGPPVGAAGRALATLGYVDWDSPFLVPPPPGRRVASPLVSALAGVADAAVLRALLDPRLRLVPALLDLGLRGLRHGVVPIADPRLVPGPPPATPRLPWRDVAVLVRRARGVRWLLVWALAGVLDRRPRPLALAAGLLARAAPPVPVAALDGVRPVPVTEPGTTRVAAIVPTLGRHALVQDVLDDLAAQTAPPAKAIVVEQDPDHAGDDAWTVEPPRPGRSFAVERLTTARPGACRARNLALGRAGEVDWLLFLDDDVRLPADTVARLLTTAAAWGAEAVQGLPHQPREDPAALRPAPFPLLWPSFATGASLVSRRAADVAGGFDERLDGGYGEDFEYGVRLRSAGAEVLLAPDVPVPHLKAPAGGFRRRHPHPWHGVPGVAPRPSPTVQLSRLLHHTPEMRRGYALQYVLHQLAAAPLHRLPIETVRLVRAWRSSLRWARHLAGETPGPGGVSTLAVVTHVPHHRHGGRLHAYAPYAREMEVWADLFPRLLIAAPEGASPPPPMSAPIDRDGVELAPLPETGGSRVVDKLRQALLLPRLIAGLARTLRRADAVHVRCPGNLGFLGVLLAPLLVRRRVAKYAGQWGGYPGEPWSFRLQRRLLASRWWGAPVTVYGEWPGQPAHVVPFFTSVLAAEDVGLADRAAAGRVAHPPGPLRVLFVGRLTAAKNVGTLVGAVAELAADSAVELTIAGDGPERTALEAAAREAGLGERVRFTGGLPFARVLDLYASHDVLVLVSETEGWPKAVTEAMAFGMVAIGSARGIVPQILDEGRGIVVPPGDRDALRDALAGLLDRPEERLAIGSRAAAWARSRTLDDLRSALSVLLAAAWVPTAGQSRSRKHILQLVDSLAAGGTERVAVQLANGLADGFHVTLGTTRAEGPLAAAVAPGVGRLRLRRRGRIGVAGILRLRRFLRDQRVDLVHAHSSSLFAAVAAAAGTPAVVVWHDHFGRWQEESRPRWPYRAAARRAAAVVAVHPALVEEAVRDLHVPRERTLYLPNFVEPSTTVPAVDLPGSRDRRVVCVANFRAQKDHATLLDAWELVRREVADADLLLVGGAGEPGVRERVVARAAVLPGATVVGERNDVPAVLRACAVGVLASRSEGMPLALLEYGAAGLAAVATSVGGCPEILAEGDAGLLVPAGDAAALAEALGRLLRDDDLREDLGRRLADRVRERYGARAAIGRLRALYADLLAGTERRADGRGAAAYSPGMDAAKRSTPTDRAGRPAAPHREVEP